MQFLPGGTAHRGSTGRSTALGLAAVVALFATVSLADTPVTGASDPLRADLEHWSAVARDTSSSDEMTKSVCQQMAAPLDMAMAELRGGRRWSALHRLAPLRINLAAALYVEGLSGKLDDDRVFEAEYGRIGRELRADSARATPAAFEAITPAVLRAEAEATFPQALMFHDASLEYGRNTMLRYGFFYLGGALAQRDFATLCRSLASSTPRPAPKVRSVRPEVDALQDRLVAAYRPPASVARHSEFIAASSVLKEARALDAAGLLDGALLRYLQAVTRAAPLLGSGHEPPPDSLAHVLDAWEARIQREPLDHSLGELMIELARGELVGAPGMSPANAIAITLQTLPAYFDALAPAGAAARETGGLSEGTGGGMAAGAPGGAHAAPVTVTLVRWPFT